MYYIGGTNNGFKEVTVCVTIKQEDIEKLNFEQELEGVLQFSGNRGIKHYFPFINIRKVPREVLKTEGAARGFQPSRGPCEC